MEKKIKTKTTIRIDIEVLEKLREIAEESGRSVNRYIAYLMKEEIKRIEKEKKI